jgi:hypothetical protein
MPDTIETDLCVIGAGSGGYRSPREPRNSAPASFSSSAAPWAAIA